MARKVVITVSQATKGSELKQFKEVFSYAELYCLFSSAGAAVAAVPKEMRDRRSAHVRLKALLQPFIAAKDGRHLAAIFSAMQHANNDMPLVDPDEVDEVVERINKELY